MRTDPGFYTLTFLLPRDVKARAGRHQPCAGGCALEIGIGGQVTISGPSPDIVFEQARRFLRVACKGLRRAFSIAALLATPRKDPFGRPFSAGDSWSIIIGADIAFSPTRLPPVLPGDNVVPIRATG